MYVSSTSLKYWHETFEETNYRGLWATAFKMEHYFYNTTFNNATYKRMVPPFHQICKANTWKINNNSIEKNLFKHCAPVNLVKQLLIALSKYYFRECVVLHVRYKITFIYIPWYINVIFCIFGVCGLLISFW